MDIPKREWVLAQDRRIELEFDFFQFGKQEIATLDFFAVFEADEIGFAGGS